jgi:hypothetical protein
VQTDRVNAVEHRSYSQIQSIRAQFTRFGF